MLVERDNYVSSVLKGGWLVLDWVGSPAEIERIDQFRYWRATLGPRIPLLHLIQL